MPTDCFHRTKNEFDRTQLCLLQLYFPVYNTATVECMNNIAIHWAHTRLTALCPGLPRWAGTRKVKPIWILLKQETVNGSGISWAICKSAPCSREITVRAPHHSVFYRPDTLPVSQPTVSKHWRHGALKAHTYIEHWLVKWQCMFTLCREPLCSSVATDTDRPLRYWSCGTSC